MTGCYIIVSKALNQFYIGTTHEGVANRILKHNRGVYGKPKFTYTAKINHPWPDLANEGNKYNEAHLISLFDLWASLKTQIFCLPPLNPLRRGTIGRVFRDALI
jgi:hypothetical protein